MNQLDVNIKSSALRKNAMKLKTEKQMIAIISDIDKRILRGEERKEMRKRKQMLGVYNHA